MSSTIFVYQGGSPLILSQPHTGTEIPEALKRGLIDDALALKDTDWWIDRLFAPLAEQCDATIVRTPFSRTVIDVNRDPSGAPLYPGQSTTGLCPTETFDGEPLYRPGQEPDAQEIADRRTQYFEPYHAALRSEIDRVTNRFGYAILHDCHSIRSVVPRLFDGELPALNLGTNDGRSLDPALQMKIADVLGSGGHSHVTNGRFKGGWITRHYGDPRNGVQAMQMEIAQRAYMDEPEVAWNEDTAETLRPVLASVLGAALEHSLDNDRDNPGREEDMA